MSAIELFVIELFVRVVEENQTRKILAALKECGNLEEAVQKIEKLTEKFSKP